MELKIEGFADGDWIPERYAFAVPDPEQHMQFAANRNPGLNWQDVPEKTASLVLLCYDDDVPARADDVNQADRTIAKDFERTRFYHWVMVDLAVSLDHIAEGSVSDGITKGGKPNPPAPDNARQGLNDYTGFMAGDPELGGQYFGYDGPCPPWNDERMHHYHFVLYATDLERCPVKGDFTGAEVEQALKGHILAKTEVTGRYSLYPALLQSS
ncbi:MAG: YbhB/YbcL family Raf kinase inhibitor-like protein [Gammaproteobacteria bacterium]